MQWYDPNLVLPDREHDGTIDYTDLSKDVIVTMRTKDTSYEVVAYYDYARFEWVIRGMDDKPLNDGWIERWAYIESE